MKKMNAELQKMAERVKSARTQIQTIIQDKAWMGEAKKYAEKQGNEVKKLINSDVHKLRSFLEKEKSELEKIQKQIPVEIEKMKGFVDSQKKELQKLLVSMKGKAGKAKKRKSKKGPVKKSKKAGTARSQATTN